jgi:hypothetical protein
MSFYLMLCVYAFPPLTSDIIVFDPALDGRR